MINPALSAFPVEASIIGAIVVGYGEIDISMIAAAGAATGLRFELLDALEEINSERARTEIIRKLAAPGFAKSGLSEEFGLAIDAMTECREVRNYYAHCHYGYFHHKGCLLAIKARDLFASGPRRPQELKWRRLTESTLSQQERFFENTRAWWLWLDFMASPSTRSVDMPRPPVLPKPPRDAGPYEINDDEMPSFWQPADSSPSA